MIYRFIHILFLVFIAAGNAFSQVETSVDRQQILMGEEVQLELSVDASLEDLVVFPQTNRIGSLEVIESYAMDTLKNEDGSIRLFKKYGLTQWDSGDYKIPALKILKNQYELLSDSLTIQVREVAVDTTKQKMFDIKDSIEVPYDIPTDWSWLWWFLSLIPLGGVVYALSRKREKKTYEETLQPYEWTRYRLKQLDDQQLIEHRRVKEYYTEITYIIRKYIDSKVYGQALESTTGQLLDQLQVVMKERGMNITTNTELRLREILERADLVKFAGAHVDAITAREDRLSTTDIIYNIHQVLPPPTEEELLEDAAYQRKLERQAQLKKAGLWTAAGVAVVATAVGSWIYFVGIHNVKDQILGNELRGLYEQQWMESSYGLPAVSISTPDVMVRQDENLMPDTFKDYINNEDTFMLGENGDDLVVYLSTIAFKEQAPVKDLNPQDFLGPLTQVFEKDGATNIVMLDKEIEHKGKKGMEFVGSFEYSGATYEYDLWLFNQYGGLQQIMVVYRDTNEEDAAREYGRLIKERIFNSLDIEDEPKKQQNKQQ